MTLEKRKEEFIRKAMAINSRGNIRYNKVVYVNNRTPVELYDTDLMENGQEYGTFWQTPSNHLKGQQHPLKRGKIISCKKQISQEDIIRRFKEVHCGENLDYSQVVYKGMHTKVKIISHDLRPDGTEYGEFWQEPCVHLKGCSHPDIGKDRNKVKQTYTTEKFIELAKKVHPNDNYDYSLVNYTGSQEKVAIICNKVDSKGNTHGCFFATPDNFLQGKGCPKCGNHLSRGEDEIIEFIKNEYPHLEIIQNDHKILGGQEIDIFIPLKNLGIEYNGLRWHSEMFNKDRYYHLKKQLKANDCGVKLIEIFEDEYLFHKNIVLEKIRRIIGGKYKTVGARKCVVEEINKKEAKEFLNNNHIQGFVSSSLYLGAFFNGVLIGVMSFKDWGNGNWELTRFATHIQNSTPGLASKMFKHFVSLKNPATVKSFLDRRWCMSEENNVYEKMGFEKDSYVKPNYRYTNGHGVRKHKFGFRKSVLNRKYGFPLTMTENEMAEKLGYYKIWDCGLIKYIWKNHSQ